MTGAGPADEDEIYENLIVGTNMVYRLGDEKLHPVQDYWGKTLKHDMLKSNEVRVSCQPALLFLFARYMYQSSFVDGKNSNGASC